MSARFMDQRFLQKPGIVFPKWARSLGFEDASWHSDLAAHARLVVGEDWVTLWVTEEKPIDREFHAPGQFYVELWKNGEPAEGPPLFATESAKECEKWLREYKRGLLSKGKL